MEFSESFEFGNSTFMKLEIQANHEISDEQNSHSSNERVLDVILESPTGSMGEISIKKNCLSSPAQHSNKTDCSQQVRFRRSKSDSTIAKVPSLAKEDICDNYSEFFKSDFSMPLKTAGNADTSYLGPLEIQATFVEVNKRKNVTSKSDSPSKKIAISKLKANNVFKSDHKIGLNYNEPTKHADVGSEIMNYSEFFKSDFSMPMKNPGNEHSSYLGTLEIEDAFVEIDKRNNVTSKNDSPSKKIAISKLKTPNVYESDHEIGLNLNEPTKHDVGIMKDSLHKGLRHDVNEDNEEGSLDRPIFSEDLKDFIQTEDNDEKENIWEDSLPLSSMPKGENNQDFDDPHMNTHDVSSFLYQPQELRNEIDKTIKKDLRASHKVFKVYEKPQFNKSPVNDESLTSMSKNQIQVSHSVANSTATLEIYQQKAASKNKNIHKTNEKSQNLEPMPLSENNEVLMCISSWNLPYSIQKEYERKGVRTMFDWQLQCLKNSKVLFEHCNLVYSAPTSAGKTLVSEILLMKTVLERRKKVLLILPFISVVREKMFYLQDLLTAAGYRVEGFFGGYSPPGGFESINVAICTIEKANSIVNKLLEQGKLEEIGTVIVDEVHLISDPGRGYILELLLTKILYMSRKYALQIQIITMSATLANIDLLKKWLDAELFVTNYRPVTLQEMIKVGNKLYDCSLKVLRAITEPSVDIKEPFPSIVNDADHVAQLCVETIVQGCSVLVFCPSKDWCENLALQLAGAIHAIGKHGGEWGTRLRAQLRGEKLREVKNQLKDIPTGLDSVLEKTITYGCAFHHAGLTTEERDIVEAGFKSGSLKIIVATSTLSSGVNLPARRVLIRSPLFGGKQMSPLTYRQMIGRAGRKGQDTLGESILICSESNVRVGKELITADLKPLSSCLDMDSSTHLKRALLEVISSGVATSKEDIDNFVNCTLLSAQRQMGNIGDSSGDVVQNDECIGTALDFLLEYEFVRLQRNEDTKEKTYVATRLGMACLASSMPPTDGLILFAELQKSRRCFVLESELHAVYLVTPYSVCYQFQEIDWLLFLDFWEKLTPAMRKVGELVGVKESFLVRAMRGQTKLDYKLLQIHKRFYIALALQELVNETPISVVASKFKCSRGILQSLQQMASTFAGIVTSFCSSLQWDTLTLIVSQFKERLFFGIQRDLIDLMRIPDLNHKRARALFDGGITSLVDLASSDVAGVEKILFNACSFDSVKQHENENAAEAAQRNEARNFYITGKAGITVREAAQLLIKEARQFVQYEIGVGNINWSLEYAERGDRDGRGNEGSEIHKSYDEEKYDTSAQAESRYFNANEVKILSPNSVKKLKEHHGELQDKMHADETHTIKLCQQNQLGFNCRSPIIKFKKESAKSKLQDDSVQKLQQKQKKLQNTDQKKTHKSPNNSFSYDNHCSYLSDLKHIERSYKNEMNKPREVALKTSESLEKLKFLEETDSAPSKTSNDLWTNNVDQEEEPSTSKKAQRLLKARQLSEMKKQEWAKRREEEEIVTSTITDHNNFIDIEKRELAPKSVVNINSINKNDKSENSPQKLGSINSIQNTETKQVQAASKLPRRSLRNLISSTRVETTLRIENSSTKPTLTSKAELKITQNVKSRNELRESEKKRSLIFNAEAKNDSAEDDIRVVPDVHILNQPQEDEIPSSQQLVEDIVATRANSPYASKFFRSLRATQRMQSPRVPTKLENLNDILPTKEPFKYVSVEPATSASIELSDLSMENSLIKNPIHLNASHILSCSKVETDASSFKSIDIIDICGDQHLFKLAFKELMANKRLGISLGTQQQNQRKPLIGANLLLNQVNYAEKENELKQSYEFKIDDTQYLSGLAFCISDNLVYFMNMQAEGSCEGLTSDIKSKYLRMLLRSSEHCLLMYDTKDQLKVVRNLLKDLDEVSATFEDPKVANWLLQPDKIHNLNSMAQQFAPECIALVNLCGTGRGYNSYGLDYTSAILAKVRCSIECCVTVHILKGQIENLERIGTGQLYKFFKELEMPLQLSLCNMEVCGFPANSELLQKLFQQMVNTMKRLETKIYELHGSRFNLGSSSAVARVLGLHRKTNGRISTSKQILEKIDTPISQMIIIYRKISVTLTKNIQPLLKSIQDERIHGSSITFTSTGRIAMSEPNLQNVAKDFNIDINTDKYTISCRSAFCPSDQKRCLISSDFCQLEMRILAHLSQDSALLDAIKSEKDIFVAIAARWNKIPESNVTDQERNGTKQICYGIVYGMGMRALAEGLKCTEQEAKLVTEQFHMAYSGIRTYAEKIIKFARNNGYIETITGRRRYLENINSEEFRIRTQAERQAINSTIQGSAADIAKSAILRMEKNVVKYREKLGIDPKSVRLVLHLHDELIFEVPEDKAKKIAKVLRVTMENCVKLNVPLKVKLKIGKSWGELQEIKF